MKQFTSTIAKVTIAVSILGAVAACQNKTETKTATPATAVAEKAEIVYVNQDTLLTKYEYFKDMTKRLQEKGDAAKSDLQSKGQAFDRDVADYKKNIATLSADQRASTEQRLGRKQQELQAYQQNATAQFQNEQAGENEKLYNKVADFTKVYAKEKGYKLVLTYSKANPTVLFGDPSLDVTADVVKRLNDLYAKDKK
ncbi:OmpH family outer membrane protein [Mucilaginibacter sp. HMF5004]|uniref:OmpH family outer membrane protein n=1 Tax=Mucilaginibacter rivuli TaxID=2857527 RepID=UPI001C5FA829|nr:OmpH family outer membrane protein [Mucilaginibacter rivuli]MBW4890839.1 OmpH family outer membrane protein [Mucilaginibacter rivuli]